MSSGADVRANPAPPAAPAAARAGSSRFARLVIELFVAAALALLVRAFVVQSFYVPSESMEPTVLPAQRVLVDKVHGSSGLQRGDLIVFDATTTFGGPSTAPSLDTGVLGRVFGGLGRTVGINLGEKDYLKRIIGMPGDHVTCCTATGHLTVNGVEVLEPYLPAGMRASESAFDVRVPASRLWVMGDNRPVSADSRAHLGDPGGGMVPVNDVVGRVVWRYWPLGSWGSVQRSEELAKIVAEENP